MKAEGRYLTKKQKEERAMAEARKQALLQSGVIIEGLQKQGEAKRPVYNKKKGGKGAPSKALESETASQVSRGSTPAPEPVPLPAASEKKDDKDEEPSWEDGSDDDEPLKSTPAPTKAPAKAERKRTPSPEPELKAIPKEERDEGVKSDWDDSSDEEGSGKPPAPATKPAAKEAPKTEAKEAKGKGKAEPTVIKGIYEMKFPMSVRSLIQYCSCEWQTCCCSRCPSSGER
jgi:translation initiation factor 5B